MTYDNLLKQRVVSFLHLQFLISHMLGFGKLVSVKFYQIWFKMYMRIYAYTVSV